MPKKSYIRILNGDSSDDENFVKAILGKSKQQFESEINEGFERNLDRYKKRTEKRMAREWSNKVAASDRAEAKLYPVLSIDTASYAVMSAKNKNKSSIYE